MQTRVLHTRIYSDSFFSELTPIEKLLFIYYLTNEHVNIIHCYECPNKKASYDTGIDTPSILLFQEKMEKAGKMFFKDGYVLLKNASKYETYTGDLNDKAKKRLLEQLSIPLRDWYEGGMKGVYIPTINHKSEIINHKSNKEGVVKGKQKLEDLTDEDIEEISIAYKVPKAFVLSKIDDMKNYCWAKGKRYKDYKAALRNWVKKDALERKEEVYGRSKIAVIKPDPNWST